MKIRKATIKDFEILKDIKLLSKKEEMKYSDSLKPLGKTIGIYFEYFKAELEKKNSAVFIAEDKKPIGIIIVTYFDPLRISKFARKGYVSNLYVMKTHRKKGIGKKLLNISLKWLKENKVKYISLEIHLKNKKALNFYRGLGFKDYTLKLAKKI
jgi:ribosomal protein S18 acetylase RimI-like enzyme